MSSLYDINLTPIGAYHFISKLVPGAVLLFSLIIYFPSDFLLDAVSGSVLVSVLLLAYAAGQFLHSLSVFIDNNIIPTTSHRKHLMETRRASPKEWALFQEAFESRYGEFPVSSENPAENIEVYTRVRSFVEIRGRGRSITFQALHSLCRSMRAALLLSGANLLVAGLVLRPVIPSRSILASQISAFAVIVLFLVLVVSSIIFEYGNRHYKELYGIYLLVDFSNLVLDE